jgi:hypothetical protein
LATPAGRADDFSWPRKDVIARPAVSPEVAAPPSTPENQGPATKGDGKKQADAKKDAKVKSKIGSHVSAGASHPYYNYYPGRQTGSYRGDFSSRRDELTSGAR